MEPRCPWVPCFQGYNSTPPTPAPGQVTENPTRNELTTSRKKGNTTKSARKVTVDPKQAPVDKSNKPAKPKLPSQTKEVVAPIQPNQSPIEEISDLFENLALNAGWISLAGSSMCPIPPYLDSSLVGCAQNRRRLCS